MRKYLGNKVMVFALAAPAMILFSVMVLYPLGILVVKSFTQWDGLNPSTFNGIQNYIRLFKDPVFYTSLRNGVIFALIQVCIQVPVASILAFAVMDSGRISKNFFRVAYFVPAVLSITVVSQLWLSMYNAEYGMINKLFTALGLSYQQNWLGQGKPPLWPSRWSTPGSLPAISLSCSCPRPAPSRSTILRPRAWMAAPRSKRICISPCL